MKKSRPTESHDAYVKALDGWRHGSLFAAVNWRRLAFVLVVLSLCIALVLIVMLPVTTPGAWLVVFAGTTALTFGAGLVIVVAFALTDGVLLERVINGPINWLLRIGPPKVGPEAMLGTSATLIEAFDSERHGRVELHGEIWNARLIDSVTPPQLGTTLTVLEVQGLSLTVGPVVTGSLKMVSSEK